MLRPQTQSKKTLRSHSKTSLSLMMLAGLGLTAVLAAGLTRSVESKSGAMIGVGADGFARRMGELRRRHHLSTIQPGEKSFVPAAPPLVTITVDRTDDNPAASSCTAAPNDCSLRGAIILANSIPGTTIMVPAGTYQLTIDGSAETGFCTDATTGDLDISGNNTTIIGAGASTTIIQQTQPHDRVMCVDANLDGSFNFSISGVTITGGRETFGVGGGGIVSGAAGDNTTVQDCIISGNQASGSGSPIGGGLANVGGSLTLSGTTFDSNTSTGGGGGVYFGGTPGAGTLSVSNSSFTNNTSSSGNGGGLLTTQGSSYTVSGSSFTGNKSQGSNGQGGGIFNESGTLSVTTSSFSGNQVTSGTGLGGGIANSNSATIAANFNRIAGNLAITGSGASNNGGSANFNDNWWGCNGGPGSSGGCNTAANSLSGATLASWLQLRHVASPNSICANGTSTLTADTKGRNAGSALTTELDGLPAFPSPAAAIFGNAVLGSLSGASMQFVNGVATATFTAGSNGGGAGADATADNQTVNASLTINENTTSALANQNLCAGGTAAFTTTASGDGPFTFVWKKGSTVLNNGDLGGRVTITSASGTSTLSISNVQSSDADTYTVAATGSCSTATQSATLSINTAPVITLNPVSQTISSGNVTFTAAASGTPAPTVQWQVSTNGGASFSDIPGATSTSLTFATNSSQNGNQYRAVFTNPCGTATTTAATLTTCTQLTALGPANVWIGLKNSDDVGTKFDLLASVFVNGNLIGSGQLNDVPGGSSGFNNAVQRSINMALPSPTGLCAGSTLSFTLSVRIAASSTHTVGTARLWYNDAAANSRFNATVNGASSDYFLLSGSALGSAAGPGPKNTIDVLVNRNVGGNPFMPFGTWTKTF